MRICIFLPICILFFVSCDNGIPKEKLTIIENITLGGTSTNYNKQFDSLQIPNKRFFNKILMMKFNDLLDADNYYSSYYTNLFNFSEYRNAKNSVEHLGLITPVTLEGTNNNFALIVLLCHTVEPWLWADAERFKSSTNEKYIRQEVNNAVIEKVKKMFIDKYGEPKNVDTSAFNTVYVIDGTSISKKSDNSNPAVTYTWDTEYFTVKFFSGMDLNGIYSSENGYVESTNRFVGNIGDERADPLKNQMHCKSLAYIYYELNHKAMQELKLDTKKL